MKNFVLIVSVTALKLYKTEQELITFGQVPKTVLVVCNTLLRCKFLQCFDAMLLEPAQKLSSVPKWQKTVTKARQNITLRSIFYDLPNGFL